MPPYYRSKPMNIIVTGGNGYTRKVEGKASRQISRIYDN
jgi:hypothetical protein